MKVFQLFIRWNCTNFYWLSKFQSALAKKAQFLKDEVDGLLLAQHLRAQVDEIHFSGNYHLKSNFP